MRNAFESMMLQKYGDRERARGCKFIIDPRPPAVDPAIVELRPDAVAYCPDGNRFILANAFRSDIVDEVERVEKYFKDKAGWKVVLLFKEEIESALDHIESTIEDLSSRLADIKKIPADLVEARLLAIFALFEGNARLLFPAEGRPVSIQSLVEALASEGVVTPTQADNVRAALSKRNMISHGGTSVTVEEADVVAVGEAILAIGEILTSDVRQIKLRALQYLEELRSSDDAGNAVALADQSETERPKAKQSTKKPT